MLYFTNLFFRELPNGSKFRKFGVGCQGQHTINLFASDTPCCFATSEKDVGSKPILQLHQCDNMQILFVIGYKKQKYNQYIYHFLIWNKCHQNKMVSKFVFTMWDYVFLILSLKSINTVEYIDAFCEHAKTFAVKNACRIFGTLHL